MKNALIFLTGIIVGVVCLYAWQGYQVQRITMGAPISNSSVNEALERQSFAVTYGKPVRVEMIGSEETFTLTLTRLADGNVEYAWQSAADEASSGDGVLFEKYEEVAKTPTGTHVKDVGSSLEIDLGGLALEWSSGLENSGYIYYNPRIMTLAYKTKD